MAYIRTLRYASLAVFSRIKSDYMYDRLRIYCLRLRVTKIRQEEKEQVVKQQHS